MAYITRRLFLKVFSVCGIALAFPVVTASKRKLSKADDVYLAMSHVDYDSDIRDIPSFTPAKQYVSLDNSDDIAKEASALIEESFGQNRVLSSTRTPKR